MAAGAGTVHTVGEGYHTEPVGEHCIDQLAGHRTEEEEVASIDRSNQQNPSNRLSLLAVQKKLREDFFCSTNISDSPGAMH